MAEIKLIKEVDYTLEDGKVVFSREYLLRRGYCCNKRCKNCPWVVERVELGKGDK
jgi:hypothetical protein